ncbi:MAG: hypothetical protein N2652_12245 [Kiritimatiellae bacterium]|nr:hypothetical protein [Kiritimatiellia bacterium]
MKVSDSWRVWRFGLVAATVLVVVCRVGAQEPQAYLKVTRASSTRGAQVVMPTWGTHSRDYSRSVAVNIQVRGMGSRASATLEWYFIARSNRNGELWIFDEGREAVELDPSKLVELQKASKELAASVSEYGAWMREERGSRVEGYVVRVVAGTKVLAVDASAKTLEVMARDPVKWAALVEKSEKIRAAMQRERAADGGGEAAAPAR